MRTSKPVATISYNTKEFLIDRLNQLINDHAISDYMFIHHDAEADERKDHFHLWIEPNKLLDTMDIQKFLKEIDLDYPDMPPLGCINFKSSKVDDWILYAQHYPPYLASKGEVREFIYSKEDFCFYDEQTFEDLYHHAFHGSDWARKYATIKALQDGIQDPKFDATELVLQGIVPFAQSGQLSAFMRLKERYGTVYRGNHSGHEEFSQSEEVSYSKEYYESLNYRTPEQIERDTIRGNQLEEEYQIKKAEIKAKKQFIGPAEDYDQLPFST